MSQSTLTVLNQAELDQVIDEGISLLSDPGVRIHNLEALDILEEAGAGIDRQNQIAHIPLYVVENALDSAPEQFALYNLRGEMTVQYGADQINFDPGSAAISILDSDTGKQRPPLTDDFIRFVKLVELLPQIDAQSTAFVCADVIEEIGDLYRLYLALNFMNKPIVTGAFRKDTWLAMYEMLVVAAGGNQALQEKPIAIFDVCPSPGANTLMPESLHFWKSSSVKLPGLESHNSVRFMPSLLFRKS